MSPHTPIYYKGDKSRVLLNLSTVFLIMASKGNDHQHRNFCHGHRKNC